MGEDVCGDVNDDVEAVHGGGTNSGDDVYGGGNHDRLEGRKLVFNAHLTMMVMSG